MVYCAYTMEYYTILKKKTFPRNELHNTHLIQMSGLHKHRYSTASFTVLKNYNYVLDAYPPIQKYISHVQHQLSTERVTGLGGKDKGKFHLYSLFLHCLSLCAYNEHEFLPMCIYGHVKI